MTKKRTSAKRRDLMTEIDALKDQIHEAATVAGLARYLANHGAVTVRPHAGSCLVAADIAVRFQPNHGLEHEMTTLVTSPGMFCAIDTHAKRQRIADLYVLHMIDLRDRAAASARTREAIAEAAAEVIAETALEGIAMRLMRIEPAPRHVYGDPGARGDLAQVFYVHLLMPHDDAGVMTEDVYTIDADQPEEFAGYLRHRTLPELRELFVAGRTESVAA